MRVISPIVGGTVALIVVIGVGVLGLRERLAPMTDKSRQPADLNSAGRADVVPALHTTAMAAASEDRDIARTERRDARTVGSPLAAQLNAPGGDATHDVETLHALLKQYLHHLGRRQGLPIGNDSDLARALTGHNPMKLVVIPKDHGAISPDGRLRDRWGTPYFIHPRGHSVFEIRSAGADGRIFTSDDVVENPAENETRSR
jgi:hypothetical protein